MFFNLAQSFLFSLYIAYATSSPEDNGSTPDSQRQMGILNYENCGIPKRTARNRIILKILGGSNATEDQWPWMAYIKETTTGSACGGTLISDQWILTAASCLVRGAPASNYNVALRRYYHDDKKNKNQLTIPINRTVIHTNYTPQNHLYDIAMLQINEPINFTQFSSIRPACLVDNMTNTDDPNDQNSFVGKACVTLGWGQTEDFAFYSTPTVLQQLKLTVYNETACHDVHNVFVPSGGPKFCAGGKRNRGTCQGDGGGPLLCYHGNHRYYLHGIVSAGIGCGTGNVPDFFTEVGFPAINNWIREQITQR